MPSELFKNLGNSQPQKQQDPREQALNLMKQQGIDVPQGMENNPQAIIQHLMQSGRVPQGRVQQIMSRMFRR
jgi:RIO-like serine/threonine protein kinase